MTTPATDYAEQLFDAADSALGNVTYWSTAAEPPEDHAAARVRLHDYIDTIEHAAARLRTLLPLLPPVSHPGAHPMTTATPTTISHLDDGRWLVTRHGLSSHHSTLAAACIEAGWAGDLPAHRPTSLQRSPSGSTASLLHRPGSLTHPWAVSTGAQQTDYADVATALSGLIRLAEQGDAPHVGAHAQSQLAAAAGYSAGGYPSLRVLLALAAAVEPAALTAAHHQPHGVPADLAHPTEPQE